MQIISIIIDNGILEEYNKYYFEKYPKRKVAPIKKPIIDSINKWTRMRRPEMNASKQKWNEFILWVLKKKKLENLRISSCEMEILLYFPTKARHDADNYTPKFINDALVESGLLPDDSFSVIKSLKICGFYDKENPRIEIHLKVI